MKVAIQQKVLVNALEKGALAALSEEAQSDTSIISILIKSVKIKVDSKNLTVESATKLMATKCVIPIVKDGGIDVKEEGEILVQAKDLCDWVKKQPDYKIAIALKKLDTPDVVNPISNDSDGSVIKGIKRIGNVVISSRDETKTGNKGSLDCYASDQLGDYSMELPADKKFEISPKELSNGLRSVNFACMPKHYQHIYDSISFQNIKDKLYMMTCDTARAALYEVSDVKNNKLDSIILVPNKFLTSVSGLLNEDENVALYFDSVNNKIFLTQGEGLIVKMNTTDAALVSKFPSASTLIEKKYKPLCVVPKGGMANRLITAALVNENAALYSFKNNSAIIYVISSSGKAPGNGTLPVGDLKSDFNAVWGVTHLLDYLKVLKDEEVQVFIPDGDKKSVRFITKQEPSLSYYIMTQDATKTKYDQVKIDD